MAATLLDRYALAENITFQQRCAAGAFQAANVVGLETSAEPSDKAAKRVDLLLTAIHDPDAIGRWVARAASGWNPVSPATDIGDTYADAYAAASGTPAEKAAAGVAAITDTQIINYIAGAWNVLAGVRPWERA